MSSIHPTAIVDSAAELAEDVEIGPYVVISGPVKIGARTRIMSHCCLYGDTVLLEDNVLHAGVVIGDTPQHLGYHGAPSGVRIGAGNIFREYVTVHRAYEPGGNTVIGDRCFFMACSHVAHDCVLGNHIIMANSCLLGGHVTIEDRVVLSGNVAVHQFVRIGELAMIGGLAKVVKDIPPYMLVDSGSHVAGLNSVGLRRAGFSAATRESIKHAYKVLYRSGLNVSDAVAQLEHTHPDCPEVMHIVDFVRKSSRGISRHEPLERGSMTATN
ncbi:MAG: acyl-ACP--UDP-N-acetylglucosamine O-acyltransferase [Candidatus Sumerlaeaceae bacterium]|nr:acyl-ACP--UDP-N-acetylglucosamine O-acyltransferase [Candidatus Sumerlaeaceae bacterium]